MIAQHTKRITLIYLLFCSAYLILAINLYRLQISNHQFYQELGTQQYHVKMTQLPPRAPILDRTGKQYLAMNRESLSAFILPDQLTDKETLAPLLREYFPAAFRRWNQHTQRSFLFIARKLTPAQLELLATLAHPDIKVLKEPSRYYPSSISAPCIGITNSDNKGLMGIELFYNATLTGTATTSFLEKDARSGYFYFQKETAIEGKKSTPLTLTLDSSLQFLTYQAVLHCSQKYDAREAGALIMDPTNGDILAMVTIPHFDPDNTQQLDLELTKNRTISNAYEMGSVMKVFAALAALEEGVVTADELIDCRNSKSVVLDGRRINTVTAHGVLPFWQVIARSNNIGIAIVAKRLQEKLYDHYVRLGFGKKTGISLPGEAKGFVNYPDNWSKQSIISLSYGYEVTITLLQLACGFCLIAHDGHPVKPRINLADPVEIGAQLYSTPSITAIQEILEQTTLRGTMQHARIAGYKIMSKTGTANILEDGAYNPDRNMFISAGIIQKNGYQRVIAVYVRDAADKNLYAATVTAPLFEQIAQRLIIHERA